MRLIEAQIYPAGGHGPLSTPRESASRSHSLMLATLYHPSCCAVSVPGPEVCPRKLFPSVKWRYSVSTARVFRRLCPWCIAGAQQTLASFFCSSGTRGRARGTEGHFMPCLAALVVRRAGPERESVGDAPHCGQVISARKSFQCQPAEFWAPGWAVGHFFLERDT